MAASKRKAEKSASSKSAAKKRSVSTAISHDEAQKRFRNGLFDATVLDDYAKQYSASSPYKHAVINKLVNDSLLRNVRNEIRENVSFTPKETDIYKIHQSGDLANLDGLEPEALAKLPSLLKLRDGLYSESFRNYISHITGCGPLSGKKTDMAINVYTPGCFLLCHDDVIGSRKVSYIIYLTDPDTPWQPSWGGALRLFPVTESKNAADGQMARTPQPDVAKVIPPAWNQLSFFAVQPGESFHDVEEVYHAESPAELEKQGGRVRMAISGWFHIPQQGEEGFVPGAEEKLQERSGLMQLQGNPDQYDAPVITPAPVDQTGLDDWEEDDLDFLLKYLAPMYLTPDMIGQMKGHFKENSTITIGDILAPAFANSLRSYVEAAERSSLPETYSVIEAKSDWKVARPPHKHRFLYQTTKTAKSSSQGKTKGKGKGKNKSKDNGKGTAMTPIMELLDVFLCSRQFHRWLQLVTGTMLKSQHVIARRFRRGLDYTLATGYEGKPRLEVNLGFTPTPGWGADEDEGGEDGGQDMDVSGESSKTKQAGEEDEEKPDIGGHEVYMAGDDDTDADAAVYKSSSEDDNILFFQPAAWNNMSIVLRDGGALKFVKYVSRSAKGDRWDISGTYDVEETEDSESEDEDDAEMQDGEDNESSEIEDEEWNGFSD
ncbi:putative component of NuA3 histone acetyltransferase complex [Ceratocystis pirilliformis]|uniref:Component of NuA3 histone acetyltransferase complex n=1 Tax=Ceratocystis pirilliformis TaxID=259994 RepID=A0ABR3YJF6_9PEZI